MLTYHNDHTIKFSHTPVINKIGFQVNQIGPDDPYVFPTVDYTDTDANTIYVDSDTGDDGDAGTAAAPKETLLAAINATTATKTKVVALNTAIYNEDISGGTYTYFQGVYNDGTQASSWVGRLLGYTPADANSIFVAKTGDDGDAGTQAEPKLTIAGAIAACDGTHQAVVIMDSETYEEEGFEFTGDFTGLYAAIGEAPTIKPIINISQLNITDKSQLVSNTQLESDWTRFVLTGVFSDDSFVIGWSDVTNSTNHFKIYDSAGVVIGNGSLPGTSIRCRQRIGILSGDKWIISYVDVTDSEKTKFKIFNKDGTESVPVTTVSANQAGGTPTVDILSDGNFLIVYADYNGGTPLLYATIYSADGSQIVAPTLLYTNVSRHCSASFTSGGFIIGLVDFGTSAGKFLICDNSASITVAATEFRAPGFTSTVECITLSNDSFVLQSVSKFYIYSKAGASIKGATTTSMDYSVSLCKLTGDNWAVSGSDAGDGGKGKYEIWDCLGNAIISATTFETGEYGEQDSIAGTFYDGSINVQSNDNIINAWGLHTGAGYYAIFYPYSWNALKISTPSVINGINFIGENQTKLRKMLACTASVSLINCDVYDIQETSFGHLDGYAILSDSHVDITFSKIHDCDIGVDTTEATSDFYDSQFYRINEGYAIDVTGDGSINIEHCDIFDCYGGIRLQSNDGGEVIKNNIIHDCDTYAIYCDTAVTFTNSVYTDAVSGATVGASVVKANPLYINQGYTNPDDTDLNIKTKVLGYPADSPAKDLADDSRNAGSIDIEYIGTETDWTTITVAKPFLIDVGKEYAGAVNTQRKDGSYSSYKDGQSEVVEMTWKGITNAQYTLLEALWLSESSTVRIYPDPVTYPSSYEVYTLLRKDLDDKVNYWQLARTGRQNVKLSFARACE